MVHSIPDFGSFRPRFWFIPSPILFIPSPILVHSVPDSGSFHPQSATGTKFLEATTFTSWVSKQQEQEVPLHTLLWSVLPNRILTERCFYEVSSANTFQPSKLPTKQIKTQMSKIKESGNMRTNIALYLARHMQKAHCESTDNLELTLRFRKFLLFSNFALNLVTFLFPSPVCLFPSPVCLFPSQSVYFHPRVSISVPNTADGPLTVYFRPSQKSAKTAVREH